MEVNGSRQTPDRCGAAAPPRRSAEAFRLLYDRSALLRPEPRLDEHGQRVALGLDDDLRGVAEVLAVDLQRQRPVAARRPSRSRSWTVEQRRAPLRPAAAQDVRREPGDRARAGSARGATRSSPPADVSGGCELDPEPAGVRVRARFADEGERGAAEALDLERRLAAYAPVRDQPRERRREHEVAGALAVRPSRPSASTPPDQLRVEPDPALKAKRRPFARPSEIRRGPARGEPPRRRDRVARQPERARQHARPAAGDEPERHAPRRAVDDLVEAAVAREDVDRVAPGAPRPAASSVACPGRSVRSTSGPPSAPRHVGDAAPRSPRSRAG